MKHSVNQDDLFSLAAFTSAADYAERTLAALNSIEDSDNAAVAVVRFRSAFRLMGADAGVFLSVVRDGPGRTTFRSLLACDPLWAIEYTKGDWEERDPWLRHAMNDTEPVRISELRLRPDDEPFIRASAKLGFASAVVAPAPTSAGDARVGVLCLGSHQPGFFECDAYRSVRVIARALAMELHRWLLQAARRELLTLSGLTPDDVDLLRHEEAGHSTKVICARLNMEASTINCRFQRLRAKLGAPDRRTAARIARLYGLL